jgi:hypothetical protein
MMPEGLPAKGETTISDLHSYLRNLLKARLVELGQIIHELWSRLDKLGVRIPYVALALTNEDLGISYLDCTPKVVLYLNEEEYPDIMKVEHCYGECLVYGNADDLNNTFKPNVTVLDFVKAVVVMIEEYAKIRRKSFTTRGRRNNGSVMDIPISKLLRDNVWAVDVIVGDLEDHVTISINPDYDHYMYKVTLQNTPIECNFYVDTSSQLSLSAIVVLFNKYIVPLFRKDL